MTCIIYNKEALDTNTCPKCQANWMGQDIFLCLRPQAWCADKTDDELHEYVANHYSPPYVFKRAIGIEYSYGDYRHRDGVSAYRCPDCKHTFPRNLGTYSLLETEV